MDENTFRVTNDSKCGYIEVYIINSALSLFWTSADRKGILFIWLHDYYNNKQNNNHHRLTSCITLHDCFSLR